MPVSGQASQNISSRPEAIVATIAGMASYRKIAEKLLSRRVTFATPRPPELTPAEDLQRFSQRYLSVRFLLILGVLLILFVLMLIAMAIRLAISETAP
jgi:hypothetical protein